MPPELHDAQRFFVNCTAFEEQVKNLNVGFKQEIAADSQDKRQSSPEESSLDATFSMHSSITLNRHYNTPSAPTKTSDLKEQKANP